eukprot:CAMPEP_0172298114 /NCGR_PEP_ID=MMETSP1058-20130122/905_1 /TAXON_ID=83371 /ORGANISM="Detonula confervacea, Strain CCMP 353" /LENGTH=35 /DNA_ID= /DNA_START= /DNA_END= /DNA_ORIENTATION=
MTMIFITPKNFPSTMPSFDMCAIINANVENKKQMK